MIANFKKYSPILVSLCAVLALASSGCAERTDGGIEGGESGVPEQSANLALAKDWTEFNLSAREGQSRLSTQGHFHTTSNICKKPGDGVFGLARWNKFAETLNVAQDAKLLSKARCWDSPSGSRFYNKGLAEIVVSKAPANNPNGTPVVTKTQLFEYKNGEICTMIEDPALAKSLMDQIESALQLIECADVADCQWDAQRVAEVCPVRE